MEERKIKIIALLALIIGFSCLIYFVLYSPENSQDSDQSDSTQSDSKQSGLPKENSKMTVEGKVIRIDDRGKVVFLKLSPASRYRLVSFNKLDVKLNDEVKVTGRFKIYKGSPEIIIDRIEVIDKNPEK